MSVCGQNSDSGGGAGEGGSDSVNGEASAQSSRVSTPVQNLVAAQVRKLELLIREQTCSFIYVYCMFGTTFHTFK